MRHSCVVGSCEKCLRYDGTQPIQPGNLHDLFRAPRAEQIMEVSGLNGLCTIVSQALFTTPDHATMPHERLLSQASIFLLFLLVLSCGVSHAQPVSNPDSTLQTI